MKLIKKISEKDATTNTRSDMYLATIQDTLDGGETKRLWNGIHLLDIVSYRIKPNSVNQITE
jgi:hypothetical protein